MCSSPWPFLLRREHRPPSQVTGTPVSRHMKGGCSEQSIRFQGSRKGVAAHLEKERAVRDRKRSGEGALPESKEALHPGLLPLPIRCRAVGGPLPQLRPDLYQRPVHAYEGVQRAAPDGLGLVRAAGRELRHRARRAPAHHDEATRGDLPAADGAGGLLLRLVAGVQLDGPGLLSLDPVVLPAIVPARAGLPGGR